jgi:2-polyprenyl-6-methoxyphenol hydroxylase-like FAD-dependent oxidoreductase
VAFILLCFLKSHQCVAVFRNQKSLQHHKMSSNNNNNPNVLISGGGPAGLLAAIMLDKCGISSTVIERAAVPEEWSSRSYTISIGDRGAKALQDAGADVWDAFQKSATIERRAMYVTTGEGKRMTLPQNPVRNGTSRPLLVQCLEKIAGGSPRITLKRGIQVVGVSKYNDSSEEECLQVELSDGTQHSCTHIVAADGKWSPVRNSIPEFADKFTIVTEPSWGVHLTVEATGVWSSDGNHAFKAKTPGMQMAVLCSPVPTGETCISVICYQSVLETYPFLAPPDSSAITVTDWAMEYNTSPAANDEGCTDEHAKAQRENIANMLQEEFPTFFEALPKEALDTIRVNRKVSWLKYTSEDDDDDKDTMYSTASGRVALIGDAAHAMTPSGANGCNCALESAVALVSGLLEKEETQPSIQTLSETFVKYGKARPVVVKPLQQASAEGSKQMQFGKRPAVVKPLQEASAERSK